MHNPLIIGMNSAIGGALFKQLKSSGLHVTGTTRRRHAEEGGIYLDLADPPDRWPALPRADVVYLCSAISGFDPCENNPAATSLINVERTVALARRLHDAGAFVVFISSNQVFDGTEPMRKASDTPCPVNEYGRQKVATENFLIGFPHVAILRVAKVIAHPFPLFDQWKKNLMTGKQVKGFDDMYVAPMPIHSAVEALAHIGKKKEAGIYQLSGPKDVSYYTMAVTIARALGCDSRLVVKTHAVDAGLPANFVPRHTTLANTGLVHINIPNAEDLAKHYVTSRGDK